MTEKLQEYAIDRAPMRTGNVIGWAVLLVIVVHAMLGPNANTQHGLFAATAAVLMAYGVFGIVGFAYYHFRGRPYSHTFALTAVSIIVGLTAFGDIAGRGVANWRANYELSLGPGEEPSAALSEVTQEEWAATYARFFEDPAKQYLLGPAIRDVFDEKAGTDVHSGAPVWQALSSAEAHANQSLDAVVHPFHYAELWKRPEYARLKLPGFEHRHKRRVRELLASGSEPMAALIQGADQVLAEIDQLK